MRLSLPRAVPKGPPAKLARDQQKRDWKAEDRAGSDEAKTRSGGRCEVRELIRCGTWGSSAIYRCQRRAIHLHHMIGGWKIRGRGESAKAIRKQHTCLECHQDIEGNVLQRIGGTVPHWTDVYERIN